MLKLSSDEDYLQWGACIARGRYAQAISHLEVVLGRARADENALGIGEILRVFGQTHARMGNISAAIQKFEEADQATGGDARSRLETAKFWYEICDRPDLALDWLDRIIHRHEEVSAIAMPIHQDKVVQAARESATNIRQELRDES